MILSRNKGKRVIFFMFSELVVNNVILRIKMVFMNCSK